MKTKTMKTTAARTTAIKMLAEATAQLADPSWCHLDVEALEAVAELAGIIRGASQTGIEWKLLRAHASLSAPTSAERWRDELEIRHRREQDGTPALTADELKGLHGGKRPRKV